MGGLLITPLSAVEGPEVLFHSETAQFIKGNLWVRWESISHAKGRKGQQIKGPSKQILGFPGDDESPRLWPRCMKSQSPLLNLAVAAIDGPEWLSKHCECEPEVGAAPCRWAKLKAEGMK